MTIQQYALIDKTTNIVLSTCMWNGDTNTWQPPADQYAVTETGHEYMVWTLNADKTDYVLAPENPFLPGSELGSLFDGTNFVTQEPKPAPPVQPVTSGMQTV